MTVNVDPKHHFILPKTASAVISTLLVVLISLIGYVFTTTSSTHTKNMEHLQAECNNIKREIREIEYKQLMMLDVVQQLHPNTNVSSMYEVARSRYSSITRSGDNSR